LLANDGKFELRLANGEELRARRVVFATGLSGLAQTPAQLQSLPHELASHTFQHSDYSPFAGKRVAVIGGGASAVEAGALVHEAGGTAEVLIRSSRAVFNERGPRVRALRDRISHPMSVLGPGRKNFAMEMLPFAVHFVPEARRVRFVNGYLGPAAPWWIKDRIDGKVPIHTSCQLLAAERAGSRVRLQLRQAGQGERTIEVDHVIAGTGYAYDIDRLDYLDESLRRGIRRLERGPDLTYNFESSVKGAYFLGPITALSFGPLLRFVSGAAFSTPAVARHIAGPVKSAASALRRMIAR